ncbi:MAG: secretin and TonB N-terminal domain-containing protein, partial [Muribaculaceae bacterium]|nr:secretin and TonB N-terminal domain-containing protein [Muribaculaceae bacterium]
MIDNNMNNSCLWRTLRAMLILCICFISFGAVAQASADGKDKLLTIEVTNKSVKDVLSRIEKESGYIFFYYNKGIDTRRRVSVSAKNKPVTAILDEIFKNTGVTYEIKGRQISLRSNAAGRDKDAVGAPKRKVTGVVTDADNGDPLIGVTVMADNATGVGTSTNIDGEFSIEIPENV